MPKKRARKRKAKWTDLEGLFTTKVKRSPKMLRGAKGYTWLKKPPKYSHETSLRKMT